MFGPATTTTNSVATIQPVATAPRCSSSTEEPSSETQPCQVHFLFRVRQLQQPVLHQARQPHPPARQPEPRNPLLHTRLRTVQVIPAHMLASALVSVYHYYSPCSPVHSFLHNYGNTKTGVLLLLLLNTHSLPSRNMVIRNHSHRRRLTVIQTVIIRRHQHIETHCQMVMWSCRLLVP